MALREVLVKFGVDVDQNQARAAGKTADGLSARFAKVAGAVGAGLVLDRVRDFTTAVVDMGDEIGDVSEQIGISAKELQRWRFIAESSGASSQALGVGFKILAKNAAEAKDVGSEQAKVFKALGVTVTDAAGNLKDPARLFNDVGLAVASIENPAERTAMLLKVFGKSGAELGPIFTKGAKGIEDLSKRFDDLGGGLGDDAVAALGDADQKLREFELTTRKVKGSLSVALLPSLSALSDVLASNVTGLDKAAKGTNLVQFAVGGLAATAAAGVVAWAAPFAPFILTAGAAVASITDVFNAFDSGSSKMLEVIGKVDKKLTGNDLGGAANKRAKKFADTAKDEGFDKAQGDLRQELAVARAQKKIERINEVERSGKGFNEIGGNLVQRQFTNRSVPETLQLIRLRAEAENELRFAKSGGLQKTGILDEARAATAGDATFEGANQIRAGAQAPGLSISALAGPFAAAFAQASLDQQRSGLAAPLAGGLIAGPLPGAVAPIVNLTVQTTNTTNVSTTGGDPEEIATQTATAQAKSTAKQLEATRNAIVPIIQRPQ